MDKKNNLYTEEVEEKINKRYIWTTPEFRKAKKKFLAEGKMGDKCEWCGSKEFLTPDHKWTYKNMLSYYRRKVAIETMAKEKGFAFTNSAINKTGGFSTNKGYVKVKELGNFVRGRKDIFKEAEKRAKERYLSFEDVRTLCKKCNFARSKGLSLCPICRENYYYEDYEPKRYSCCKGCIETAIINEEKYKDYLSKGVESEYYKEFSDSKIKDLSDDELPEEIWDDPEYEEEYVDRGYAVGLDEKYNPIQDEEDFFCYRKLELIK